MNRIHNNEDHFLRTLNIENYKCFKDFIIEDRTAFGRVNLIGGNNNVGKTSLLEVLFLLSYKTTEISETLHSMNLLTSSLLIILENRKNLMLTQEQVIDRDKFPFYIFLTMCNQHIKNFIASSNLSKQKIEFEPWEIKGEIDIKPLNIKSDDCFPGFEEFYTNGFYGTISKLDSYFVSLLNKAKFLYKIEDIKKAIHSFDSRFAEIELINQEIVIRNVITNSWDYLHDLGLGFERYISMITALWACSNHILFIDEIENGLHYNKYEMLWELIFKVSREANCQVFATTHSLECIKAYNTVQMRNEMSELSEGTAYYELFKEGDTGKIDILKLDKDLLAYNLKSGKGIRGEQE